VDFYPWLKAVHILLAIVAVGANITYGFWQVRAAREPQHLGYALRGIKFLDDRVANPAYGGLFVIGIILVLIGPYDFTTLWVAVSIGLFLLMGALTILIYTPMQRRQIAVYETKGPQSPEFAELSNRMRTIGIVLAVIVVVIVFLMVVKPG
jgi:uncharacterized membrane protein